MPLSQHLSRINAATLRTVWAQWGQLGATATKHGSSAASSVIDIESLILVSLLARDDELRLDDFLGWFSGVGAHLLSVQRIRNVAVRFPPECRNRVAGIARLALDAGDARWRQMAALPTDVKIKPREGKGRPALSLLSEQLLMLRLRAGIGVGAKADVLTILLTLPEHEATIAEVTEAAGYSSISVRAAVNELEAAGFIERRSLRRSTRFRTDWRRWSPLLTQVDIGRGAKSPGPPVWRHWSSAFPLAADFMMLERDASRRKWSPYVLATRTRDIVEKRRGAIEILIGDHTASSRAMSTENQTAGILEHVAAWFEDGI